MITFNLYGRKPKPEPKPQWPNIVKVKSCYVTETDREGKAKGMSENAMESQNEIRNYPDSATI